MALLMVLGMVSPAFAETGGIPAFDDSYVSSANPLTNYGGAANLFVRWEPLNEERAYLKFDLTPWVGKICERLVSVWLIGHVKDASADPTIRVDLHACRDDSWDENTITWTNAPPLEELLSYAPVGSECYWPVWQSGELTQYIKDECKGDHIVSIILKCHEVGSPQYYRAFHSKEGGTFMLHGREPPVGGRYVPINKLALLAPHIGLVSTIVVATVATAIYVKRRKEK